MIPVWENGVRFVQPWETLSIFVRNALNTLISKENFEEYFRIETLDLWEDDVYEY